MTRGTVLASCAVVVLGTLLAAGSASARKNCRRLCRESVAACVDGVRAGISCTGLRGAERRDCARTRRQALRACKSRKGPIRQACEASPSLATCSPSGAFLDAIE
jgi:hypothetical protein